MSAYLKATPPRHCEARRALAGRRAEAISSHNLREDDVIRLCEEIASSPCALSSAAPRNDGKGDLCLADVVGSVRLLSV